MQAHDGVFLELLSLMCPVLASHLEIWSQSMSATKSCDRKSSCLLSVSFPRFALVVLRGGRCGGSSLQRSAPIDFSARNRFSIRQLFLFWPLFQAETFCASRVADAHRCVNPARPKLEMGLDSSHRTQSGLLVQFLYSPTIGGNSNELQVARKVISTIR